MKEFDPILNHPDKVNIVNQRQVDYEKKFLGSTVRHKGHKFYEINCTTGDIVEAEFKEDKIAIVPKICLITGAEEGTTSVLIKEVDCKENCLYIGALNLQSAKQKYLKWLIESKGEKIKSEQ